MFPIILVSLLAFVPHSDGREVESIPISKASNQLGLRILQKLYNHQKNIFFSPFSMSIALAMVYNGAKGITYEEMRNVLGYDSVGLEDSQVNEQILKVIEEVSEQKNRLYQLQIANKIVAQKQSQILEPFAESVKNYFKSSVESVDFSEDPNRLMKEINEWGANHTNDKIKQLLSTPLDAMTQMVVLNAIYFKGIFLFKFDPKMTYEEVFYNGGTQPKKTKMMKRVGKFNYTEVSELDSKLLEIPYSGDDISLYILLPNQRQGLKKLSEKLKDMEMVEQGIRRLKEKEVYVLVPKYHMEFYYMINKQLYDLGMKSLFVKRADLSAINGQQNLFVSKFIHKSYIEISEEGTEAAAATAIRISTKSMASRANRILFKADHPFVFFIRHNKNGMILFCGHVSKF